MQHFLSIDINHWPCEAAAPELARVCSFRIFVSLSFALLDAAYVANVDTKGCHLWHSLTLISCIKSVSSSKLMRTDIIREGRHRQFILWPFLCLFLSPL